MASPLREEHLSLNAGRNISKAASLPLTSPHIPLDAELLEKISIKLIVLHIKCFGTEQPFFTIRVPWNFKIIRKPIQEPHMIGMMMCRYDLFDVFRCKPKLGKLKLKSLPCLLGFRTGINKCQLFALDTYMFTSPTANGVGTVIFAMLFCQYVISITY